jgi:hypothetical protein
VELATREGYWQHAEEHFMRLINETATTQAAL